MAALDPLEQLRARPFDPIAADAPADRRHIRRRDSAARKASPSGRIVERDAFRSCRQTGSPAVGDRPRRMKLVGRARSVARSCAQRLVARCRLVEHRAVVELQHLVGAEHQVVRPRPRRSCAFSSASASARSRGSKPGASSAAFAASSSTVRVAPPRTARRRLEHRAAAPRSCEASSSLTPSPRSRRAARCTA